MIQQGQVFELKRGGRDHGPLSAHRYRVGGRGSRRLQRGGFASREDAVAGFERELERVRRERRVSRNLSCAPTRSGRSSERPGEAGTPVMTDHVRPLDAELAEQREHVGDAAADPVLLDGGRLVRGAEAAQVGCDRALAGPTSVSTWWRQPCEESGKPCRSSTGCPSPLSSTASSTPSRETDRMKSAYVPLA
jgi:hypothetical protein